MKVYQFYLKEVKQNKVVYTLYAFTAEKKLAQEFMKIRNMDVFDIKKTQMDFEEYQRYANEHRDFLLKEHPFTTKRRVQDNGKTIVVVGEIVFLVTEMEYMLADSTMDDLASGVYVIFNENFWDSACPPLIFHKKLKDILKFLQYENMYKFYSNKAKNFYDEDYSGPDIAIDEFTILFDIIKHTIAPTSSC